MRTEQVLEAFLSDTSVIVIGIVLVAIVTILVVAASVTKPSVMRLVAKIGDCVSLDLEIRHRGLGRR